MHHLNTQHFLDTISCESNWNMGAIGDGGTSLGLAQIHLPAHTEITRAQALDPYFAIPWMASQWENDQAAMWSCWKNYQRDGWPIHSPSS